MRVRPSFASSSVPVSEKPTARFFGVKTASLMISFG